MRKPKHPLFTIYCVVCYKQKKRQRRRRRRRRKKVHTRTLRGCVAVDVEDFVCRPSPRVARAVADTIRHNYRRRRRRVSLSRDRHGATDCGNLYGFDARTVIIYIYIYILTYRFETTVYTGYQSYHIYLTFKYYIYRPGIIIAAASRGGRLYNIIILIYRFQITRVGRS